MRSIGLLPFLVVTAFANCPSKYSCCCKYDFFIPVLCECVENEPASGVLRHEKDNCARAKRSKVPGWMRLETKEWREHGICTAQSHVVSRADLDAAEKKERDFLKNYDEYCIHNKANCSSTESCFYDKRHRFNTTDEYSGSITDMGPVCVCQFPNAREHQDGTGACVKCQKDAKGNGKYVQTAKNDPDGPGAKTFHNGEFACVVPAALAAEDSPTAVVV